MILSRNLFMVTFLVFSASGAGAGDLVSYRAIYDMDLVSATERSGISDVDGRMVYEFRTSECGQYAVKFRSVAAFRSENGEQLIDQRASTVEDFQSGTFSFNTESFTDNELQEKVEGQARQDRPGGEVTVELVSPSQQELRLTEAMFPTAHLVDLLEQAAAGENIYNTTVFDGTEAGDKALLTNVVIGEKQAASTDMAAANPDMLNTASWPVSMSYYDLKTDTGGEDEPIFRLSFDMHENGIAQNFTLTYGEFVVSQKLAELEPLDVRECPRQ